MAYAYTDDTKIEKDRLVVILHKVGLSAKSIAATTCRPKGSVMNITEGIPKFCSDDVKPQSILRQKTPSSQIRNISDFYEYSLFLNVYLSVVGWNFRSNNSLAFLFAYKNYRRIRRDLDDSFNMSITQILDAEQAFGAIRALYSHDAQLEYCEFCEMVFFSTYCSRIKHAGCCFCRQPGTLIKDESFDDEDGFIEMADFDDVEDED